MAEDLAFATSTLGPEVFPGQGGGRKSMSKLKELPPDDLDTATLLLQQCWNQLCQRRAGWDDYTKRAGAKLVRDGALRHVLNWVRRPDVARLIERDLARSL
ncbi:hypothetical protein PG997_000236 [Apiospora hydei]|uniref:Uncharacterized protein n=1 Tax=Apiospora hydei TaxID=1337664 RepID=A0ABR1XA78_9PEZI